LKNRLIQASQTGGQRYNDTAPFSIPWLDPSWLPFLMSVSIKLSMLIVAVPNVVMLNVVAPKKQSQFSPFFLIIIMSPGACTIIPFTAAFYTMVLQPSITLLLIFVNIKEPF
jgi:hypothetical protein